MSEADLSHSPIYIIGQVRGEYTPGAPLQLTNGSGGFNFSSTPDILIGEVYQGFLTVVQNQLGHQAHDENVRLGPEHTYAVYLAKTSRHDLGLSAKVDNETIEMVITDHLDEFEDGRGRMAVTYIN